MNKQDALKKFVAQKMQEHHIPGVSIGILTAEGREIHSFGVTNVNHPMAVTDDTLFQIGSNTKTMTATLLMMLAYDGKLDLDAPIQTILPDFKVKDESVSAAATVRQLLTHSTGWVGDHFVETGAGADAYQQYVESMAELGQLAPPDVAASYNNAAFAVAGLIIETLTNKPYEQALVELLFKPLGMAHSLIEPGDVMLHSFAVGHDITPEGEAKVAGPWPLPRAMHSMGAVAASAGDMLTYAQFYMDHGKTADGSQILAPEAIQELWKPQFDTASDRGWVAHSWFVENDGGYNGYCHGGATVGQLSAFKIIPELNFAYTSLTNGETGRLFNADFERWVLEHYCSIVPTVTEPINPSAEQLNELVGTYSRPMQDIEVKLEGNQLMMRHIPKQGFPTADVPPRPATPWFPIALVSDNVLMAQDGPGKGAKGEIVRLEDGSIGWIRMGLRLHATNR
ncbi:MAG: serine hydrolase domain-containing protein [Anaerolineae bacterium]